LSAFSICLVCERIPRGGTGIDNSCGEAARASAACARRVAPSAAAYARATSVCSLPHGSNFTGGPAPHCGDLGRGVGTDLFKLAAQPLQLLLVCRPLVRALGGALFGARFRGDNLLAGGRNLGVGVGSDLFKVVADAL
jgi:hypothetical protein